MIFRDTSTISSILPLIKTNKNENTERNERNKYSLMEQHTQNNINNNNNKYNYKLSLDINSPNNNNRYNDQENDENEENYKNHQTEAFDTENIITPSRKIYNDYILFTSMNRNPFIAKVIVENIRSRKDCLYLLEQYLQREGKDSQYKISEEQNKIILFFDDEKTAFDFTKIIYNEKIKNALYKNVFVHMKLLPNKLYLKKQKIKKYKKGL